LNTKLRIEGIVLNALAFQDYDRILTLFTPTEGIVKLFVNRAFSSKKGKGSTTAPLLLIESVCAKGRGEFYTSREIEVIDHYLGLRERLETLNAACDMLQAVLMTQMPGKASLELYQLLSIFLKRLPQAKDPRAISCCFRIKSLLYEGLYKTPTVCSLCSQPLESVCTVVGHETFCPRHAPANGLVLEPEERILLDALAFCREFSSLATLVLPIDFSAKVEKFFHESLA